MSVDYIQATLGQKLNAQVFIFTALPIFKYSFVRLKRFGLIPFINLGIGTSIVNTTKIQNRVISTNFQFNDNLGFGVEDYKFVYAYRFTHISNLGLKMPNPGLNFHQISISYKF